MVNYSIEDWKHHSLGLKPPAHLVIHTNEITKEILESVDTEKSPNIIFQIPMPGNYRVFDLKVDTWTWRKFAQNIESLAFRGTLVEKQFTAKHFEDMNRLTHLSIGATSYPLFEGEDISKMPVIKRFFTGG